MTNAPTPDPNDVAPAVADLDTIVSLSKRRGFIFPSSEIYGGINAVWDYGPLGVELKNNVKRAWWRAMVQERDDIVGLDAGILMQPQVWVTSGHVAEFSDPMVECETDHKRFRRRRAARSRGPEPDRAHRSRRRSPGSGCAARPTAARSPPPRQFNLMLKTYLGPVEEEAAIVYLRPETAQGIYVNFKNVLATLAQEAAVRDRPDREGVPQRDQPGQLRLPDARVRADGDAVLRPAGDGAARSSRSGCRAGAPGTSATA